MTELLLHTHIECRLDDAVKSITRKSKYKHNSELGITDTPTIFLYPIPSRLSNPFGDTISDMIECIYRGMHETWQPRGSLKNMNF